MKVGTTKSNSTSLNFKEQPPRSRTRSSLRAIALQTPSRILSQSHLAIGTMRRKKGKKGQCPVGGGSCLLPPFPNAISGACFKGLKERSLFPQMYGQSVCGKEIADDSMLCRRFSAS